MPKNCRQVFSNLKDRRATSLGKMGRVQSSSELSLTHSWRGTRHVRSPKTKGTKEDTWKWKIKNHHKITMANIIIFHFFVLFYCFLVIKRILKAHFSPIIPWLLNFPDLHRYGSYSRKRYTLKLLSLCLGRSSPRCLALNLCSS